jgi:tetratricopeptide (TPR) repeat protein
MYGKTFVGNNEDYWNANTRIWFEKTKINEYGSMYVGYDDMYPQGGMNEKGLVFDGFAIDAYIPRHKSKKPIFEASMGKTIMQTCQNVDEVSNFLNKYDLSSLSQGMILYVDKSGNYLIVEADTVIKGNDDKYLLSNFCPSRTPDLNTVKIPFYQKGRKMLESKVDTSLIYLESLSDTLHQRWPDNIAGTLYTTIYDLNEGTVNLYFYHDYKHSVKFKLKDELNKGDTILSIPSMFPENTDGQSQFSKFNNTKKFIHNINSIDFVKDSTTLDEHIETQEIKGLLGFFERELNFIGYRFLKQKETNSAINIFKLNVKYSPNSWNSYDSLGDAYMKNKQYELALIFYEKSLKYKPDNESAMKQIRKIRRHLRR